MSPIGLIHAVVGVAFVAGLIGRWLVLAAAARVDDLAGLRAWLRASEPFERIVILGSAATGILGLATAIAQGRPVLGPLQGAAFDWVFVSVVLFLSILPLVPLVFLPRGRVFAGALADAEQRGEYTDDLRRAFHDRVTRVAHVYELGAVTVILILMFTKPF
jgi:hypothetical protein